jgi:hypothetical protein
MTVQCPFKTHTVSLNPQCTGIACSWFLKTNNESIGLCAVVAIAMVLQDVRNKMPLNKENKNPEAEKP